MMRTAHIFNTCRSLTQLNNGRVPPTLQSQTLRGENLTIYGDGSQARWFYYVDDLTWELRLPVWTDGLQGNSINLGIEKKIITWIITKLITDFCDADSDTCTNRSLKTILRNGDQTLSRHTASSWEPEVPREWGLHLMLKWFQIINGWRRLVDMRCKRLPSRPGTG